MSAIPDTTVVAFPGHMRPRRKVRLADGTFVVYPFSQTEVDVIREHLRERCPEICLDIADPEVRSVIERFMEHLWALRPLDQLSKAWWFLVPQAVFHLHAHGHVTHLAGKFTGLA